MGSRASSQLVRGAPRTEPARRAFMYELDTALLAQLERATQVKWPAVQYQTDPVGFFRNVLGVEPWSKQRELLERVRDNKRVAVRSGHKVSKSNTAAGVALWFFCSFPDARVPMTSTTSRQVDAILWRELRMLRSRAGRCVDCKVADPTGLLIPRPCPHSAIIADEPGELARTGLKSSDFREITGFTANDTEAVGGISGRNILFIIDEASGVADAVYEGIEGNRAGGARSLLLGNPTRNDGEHFEAFHSKSQFYSTMTISSEETPNVTEGREVIPGLATREWIEEKKLEWGEDSPLYKVRVKGVHVQNEQARIFSLHAIEMAEQRWHETPVAGRLFIGLDPAGEAGTGDETAFVARRGLKMLSVFRYRGLNDDQHLIRVLQHIAELKLPRETPVVVLDREGPIGSSLAGKLRNYCETMPNAFELVTVRASDRATRQAETYALMRDLLAANLQAWIRDGGAIVEDTKLERELHVLEWRGQTVRGAFKLIAKDQIKKLIGRSPDTYDALALSVWEPLSLADAPTSAAPADAPSTASTSYAEHTLDPYAGVDAWSTK